MKKKIQLLELLRCIFVAITFLAVDFSLRFFTRWLGYYSIFELAPSLFTVCWICIFLVALSLFPRRAGRILYAVWYGVAAIYAVAQYIYYLIFDKFFFLSDMTNAGEGAAYLDFVWDALNSNVAVMAVLFLSLGIGGFLLFPDFDKLGKSLHRNISRGVIILAACAGIAIAPGLYTDNTDAPFFSSKQEYIRFTNSGFDMEIAGMYQYVVRDTWITYLQPGEDLEGLYEQVDSYLDTKQHHMGNAMTGLLEGKNLILVQLESLDDWIISQDNTPTIFRLMEEGINFTNMYTCIYGSGSTFSTEFAFNTGIYQSPKGAGAYSMIRNHYPYSLPNLFNGWDYTTQSFH